MGVSPSQVTSLPNLAKTTQAVLATGAARVEDAGVGVETTGSGTGGVTLATDAAGGGVGAMVGLGTDKDFGGFAFFAPPKLSS